MPSMMLMSKRALALALAAAALVFLPMVMGCTPDLGDECTLDLDCSQQGDRLCDITQPGGYCTVFGCEPDKCPEDEGLCVAFNPQLDPACGPLDDGRWARFERTFCMDACDDDGTGMVECGDNMSGCTQCGLAGQCSDELGACGQNSECLDFFTAIQDCPQN